ncbi:MAG: hypothetical protein V7603_932 [Micromonosporaceae bacterium]|jgi:hypothetical protein
MKLNMTEPYGRTRRALLNKPGVFSRQTNRGATYWVT